MLAFHFDNQIARLRQFAFSLTALIVWLANDFTAMGLCWAAALASYPIGLHWAIRRVRVIAGHPDRAFVLDTAMIFLVLATHPLGLLSQVALIGGMAFVARLCLLTSSQSYQVIRLILIVAFALCGASVIEGLKHIGLQESLGLGLLLGLCFFSARTVGLVSSERARLFKAAKQAHQQTTQQLTRVKPYLSKPLLASALQTKTPRRLPLIIFFADLHDSTGAAEQLAEQAFTDFLNDYLTRMGQLVLRFNGTLDKYTGDGLMVVFGLEEPASQQALARQCALMALAMRRAFQGLQADYLAQNQPFKPGQRMGIHAGVCLAGSVGPAEQLNFTVLGRAVHVAARLEQHAGLDEILVSKEFAQLLGAEFVLAARPPADISGLRRPLNHCALLD